MRRLLLAVIVATGSAGCRLAVTAAYPLTPLATASRAGDIATIDRLLDGGADIDQGSGVNAWSPATHAIHKGQTAALAHLLDRGAKVGGAAGQSALEMAAGYGNVEMVRVLLAHGVAPSRRILEAAVGGAWDIDYRWSGCTRHAAVTQALLQKDPSLRLPATLGGRTARMWARWKGCESLLRLVA